MNTIYQGDNLSILREIPDGSIDLIATDPPFFTQKDWGSFDDRWSGGLTHYLKFMEERAVEMHRVLKDTGSLYLHCDPTASHYLKVMLDGVFGRDNFRNEIVWWYYNQASNARTYFARNHDVILFYTKTLDNYFDDVKAREPYEHGKWGDNDKYKPNPNGRRMQDVWKMVNMNRSYKERLGYPTQKPVKLYERMIQASSNPNDIVLDPFMGSGTTIDASHSLGRRWIGIDIGDDAINTVIERLRHRHGLEYDRDYEIIKESS